MPTVIDRINALRVEATKRQRWMIGAMVRDRWIEVEGSLPQKVLRQKSVGQGSHCFAYYPNTFIPVIDRVIKRFTLEQQKKGLFDA